jgi:hypothetical protein
MNSCNTQHTQLSPLSLALLGSVCGGLALSLTACGGGGSSSPTASANTNTVSGVVLDGPIQGATVCLDLNANLQCDSGEPASTPTDAQGNYAITGITDEQRNADKEWIAVVPAGATDGGTPFTQPFVLRAPGSKPSVISPITHMVQVAMDQGAISQDAAQTAVAAQLGVSESSLYVNYSAGTPSTENAILAAHAPGVVGMLQGASQPTIDLNPGQPQPGYSVRRFAYTDANNYFIRVYYPGTANGRSVNYDVRSGLSNGNALTQASLYGTTRYLTVTGWVSLDGTTARSTSPGNPSTSQSAGATYIDLRQVTSLNGKTVAEAVSLANDTTLNNAQTLPGVPSGLSGVLPAGATAVTVQSRSLIEPVAYNPNDGSLAAGYTNPALTTLDAVVAAFPAVQTPNGGGGTLSMGTLQSTYTCPQGQSSCVIAQQRLRAMLDTGNVARWVLCDLNWPANTNAGNCQIIGSGSYARRIGADGQTPLLTFSGLPTQADSRGWGRVFVETEGQVWFGYQNKLTTTVTTRLNDVAFAPIATQLGVIVPGSTN